MIHSRNTKYKHITSKHQIDNNHKPKMTQNMIQVQGGCYHITSHQVLAHTKSVSRQWNVLPYKPSFFTIYNIQNKKKKKTRKKIYTTWKGLSNLNGLKILLGWTTGLTTQGKRPLRYVSVNKCSRVLAWDVDMNFEETFIWIICNLTNPDQIKSMRFIREVNVLFLITPSACFRFSNLWLRT